MRTNSVFVMAILLTILSAQANSEEPVDPAKLAELKAAHPAWPMHNIDNTLWNHNSLSPGDVNQDGFTDYAVIHESIKKFTFVLHPGPGGDIRKPWQKVILGEGPNPEYSDFGDFDGDDKLDIVGACGHSRETSTGINIFWGPETSRVCDSGSWVDAGLIPGTKDRGHFLDVRSHDVNGDGAMDIVAGGRVLGTHSLENMAGKKTAGIVWIEAPADQGARRDLSKWTVHDIDPLTAGGHGFVFVDIDRDGDEDIADSNADWNTKPSDEMVLWYENPGVGSAQQKVPWPVHVIYKGSEIYSKGQMAAGDIDGDGRPDLCVQTEKSVFYFRQTGRNAVTWERIVIPKPAITQWLARPTKLADINGDGRLDIVGMLIHDETGNLPAEKASVFWMEWRGEKPLADNWITHVVKWSDGVNTGKKYQGEKWDHCRFTDMDADGDMDIVGNCEEHYTGERSNRTTIVGVVWFENPGMAVGLDAPPSKGMTVTKVIRSKVDAALTFEGRWGTFINGKSYQQMPIQRAKSYKAAQEMCRL